MGQRNLNIEIARYVCAFMVMCVHVPFFLRTYYSPILRCAVPFFYMVTGYFLYTGNVDNRVEKSRKNYFKLWISYLLIFSALAIGIRYFVHDSEPFSSGDVVKFLKLGFCNYSSHITVSGRTFNIANQIWFLYGGVIALAFLKLFRKDWFTKAFNVFVVACVVIPFIISWVYAYRLPQFIYLSLPSLYAGICIRRYAEQINAVETKQYMIFALIAAFLSFVEYGLCHGKMVLDGTIVTIPLTAMLFIMILRLPDASNTIGGGIMRKLPKETTLDIYLWHQFFYMLLVGLLGLNFHGFDALVVFVICMILSIVIRILFEKMKLVVGKRM